MDPMKSRLMLRVTLPIMVISFLPLAVGVITAWHVHRCQKQTSDALALNVTSMRAAEELAIGIRDVRTQLDRFAITGQRKYLEAVPRLRQETDRWLAEARRAAVTPREKELIVRVQNGYAHFFAEFHNVLRRPASASLPRRLRERINDALSNEILQPAQEYLDYNEEEIARSSEDNQDMAGDVVFGLVLLGICGPVSGLAAGFGIARGFRRSIVRLSVPVCDAAGKLNEIVGPITLSANWGLEDLEGVLRKIADQIGAVIKRLQLSQREALRAEQLAAVGQLAAGMAHELRNPLMAMKVLVQSAAAPGRPAALEGYDLTVLEEEITRLEHLTSTFLDFARPPRLEKRLVDARLLVDQTVSLVSGRAGSQQVQIRCNRPARPVPVYADIGQFRQILLNLLLNALDAVPGGGTIWVRLRSRCAAPGGARWFTLRVADTGPGLPAELGEQIFEPFVSTKPTGMGLGLSVLRRIVEAHGGQIATANRRAGGAAFTVRLPLPVELPDTCSRTPCSESEAPAGAAPLSPKCQRGPALVGASGSEEE
jgi:signal transduction histidine kinase